MTVAASIAAAAFYLRHDAGQGASPFPVITIRFSDGHSAIVAREEVSLALWQVCFEAGACSYQPKGARKGTQFDYPATDVSFLDVEEFLGWFNASHGGGWRLPTASEWTEFARELPKPELNPLFTDPRLAWAASYNAGKQRSRVVKPAGSFGQLSNGLRDVAGNVWEWTSTCAVDAPIEICPAFLLGGEHEAAMPIFARDAATGGCSLGTPPARIGLRILRDIAACIRQPALKSPASAGRSASLRR